MRTTALSAIVAPLLLGAAAAAAEDWGSFTRTSSAIVTPHVVDRVAIERSANIWIAIDTVTRSDEGGVHVSKRWADSRSCPTLVPALAGLAELEPVSIQPPGVLWPRGLDHSSDDRAWRVRGEGDETIADAPTYEIEAPGHWAVERVTGRLSMQGNADSPLAVWVETTLKALARCWSDEPPD